MEHGNFVFNFGKKHIGKTLEQVYQEDMKYLSWCIINLKNTFYVTKIQEYIAAVRQTTILNTSPSYTRDYGIKYGELINFNKTIVGKMLTMCGISDQGRNYILDNFPNPNPDLYKAAEKYYDSPDSYFHSDMSDELKLDLKKAFLAWRYGIIAEPLKPGSSKDTAVNYQYLLLNATDINDVITKSTAKKNKDEKVNTVNDYRKLSKKLPYLYTPGICQFLMLDINSVNMEKIYEISTSPNNKNRYKPIRSNIMSTEREFFPKKDIPTPLFGSVDWEDHYYAFLMNPFAYYTISHSDSNRVISTTGRNINNFTYEQYLGTISSFIYNKTKQLKWSATPKRCILQDHPNIDENIKILQANYGITFNTKYQYLYLTKIYNEEKIVAIFIRHQLSSTTAVKVQEHHIVDKIGDITLTDEQKNAVKSSLENKISIITGSAGTGKSTVIKAMIQSMTHIEKDFIMCAFTAKAKERIVEVIGHEYSNNTRTIHKTINHIKYMDRDRKNFNSTINIVESLDLSSINSTINKLRSLDLSSINSTINKLRSLDLSSINSQIKYYEFLKKDKKSIISTINNLNNVIKSLHIVNTNNFINLTINYLQRLNIKNDSTSLTINYLRTIMSRMNKYKIDKVVNHLNFILNNLREIKLELIISDLEDFLSHRDLAIERLNNLLTDKNLILEHLQSIKNDLKFPDYIIIDEATMISLSLFADLVGVLKGKDVTVILLGDINQLPPMEYGRPFEDIVNSGIYVSELTQPLRVKGGNTNLIITNSKDIVNSNHYMPIYGDNFNIYSCSDINKFIPELINVHGINIDNIKNFKFLTAKNDDVVKLNKIISETINPNSKNSNLYRQITTKINNGNKVKKEIELKFSCGDPVVFTKNGIYSGASNGTEGIIKDFLDDTMFVTVGNQTIEVKLTKNKHTRKLYINDILLAYAITVHKSQGSEWPHVYLYVNGSAGKNFMNKRLAYTGTTRAKSTFSVIESQKGLYVKAARTRISSHHGGLQKTICNMKQEVNQLEDDEDDGFRI